MYKPRTLRELVDESFLLAPQTNMNLCMEDKYQSIKKSEDLVLKLGVSVFKHRFYTHSFGNEN